MEAAKRAGEAARARLEPQEVIENLAVGSGLRGMVTHDHREAGELPKDVHAAGPHATGYMCTLDETLDRMMELFA